MLGHVASSEGAALAIRDLHDRGLCAPHCTFVPRVSSTLIAPTAVLYSGDDRGSTAAARPDVAAPPAAVGGGGCDGPSWHDAATGQKIATMPSWTPTTTRRTAFDTIVHRHLNGGDERLRCGIKYHCHRFPCAALLAPPQPFEVLDFGRAAATPTAASRDGEPFRQRRTLEFRAERAARVYGFHMHLHVELDAHATIDALATDTTWSTTCVGGVARASSDGHGVAVSCRAAPEHLSPGSVLPHHARRQRLRAARHRPGGWRDLTPRCFGRACRYVRVSREGVAVAAGERVVCECESLFDRACPQYSVRLLVGEPGAERPVGAYEWEGCG